jgi:hypothetical protein
VPRHFVAYLVFISSIRVDPGPRNRGLTSLLALKIRTPVANTGELRSIGQVLVVQREDLQIQKENTGKQNRMLNWVIWAGYGLETSVIVGMSSDLFYEWKPTLKWRKYFWTGKCNVYILTMKINRTLWLIEVINLFRRWKHRRKYIFMYHLYHKCMLFTSK